MTSFISLLEAGRAPNTDSEVNTVKGNKRSRLDHLPIHHLRPLSDLIKIGMI